jgi:hypothetical protein
MVGADSVDGAIEQRGTDRFAVALRAQRRLEA